MNKKADKIIASAKKTTNARAEISPKQQRAIKSAVSKAIRDYRLTFKLLSKT